MHALSACIPRKQRTQFPPGSPWSSAPVLRHCGHGCTSVQQRLVPVSRRAWPTIEATDLAAPRLRGGVHRAAERAVPVEYQRQVLRPARPPAHSVPPCLQHSGGRRESVRGRCCALLRRKHSLPWSTVEATSTKRWNKHARSSSPPTASTLMTSFPTDQPWVTGVPVVMAEALAPVCAVCRAAVSGPATGHPRAYCSRGRQERAYRDRQHHVPVQARILSV